MSVPTLSTRTVNRAIRADYDAVPASLRDEVCGCGGRDSFTSPVNWPSGEGCEYWDELRARYRLKFDWWVCTKCLKPAPLNALNARLIRECAFCEEPYLIIEYPDKYDTCPGCS